MKEIASESGKDREAVRSINGFHDLWKSTSEPRAVRAVHHFRSLFESLVFCPHGGGQGAAADDSATTLTLNQL
jgi:hypothetical protein